MTFNERSVGPQTGTTATHHTTPYPAIFFATPPKMREAEERLRQAEERAGAPSSVNTDVGVSAAVAPRSPTVDMGSVFDRQSSGVWRGWGGYWYDF